MPIAAISVGVTKQFESELDSAKGTPEATQFEIQALDSVIMARLNDALIKFDDTSMQNISAQLNQNAIEVVRYGVVGFKNFSDEHGEVEAKFDTVQIGSRQRKLLSMDTVGRIPTKVIAELKDAIMALNSVTETEVKN